MRVVPEPACDSKRRGHTLLVHGLVEACFSDDAGVWTRSMKLQVAHVNAGLEAAACYGSHEPRVTT